jgi:glucose/arabinose dehydrogenase
LTVLATGLAVAASAPVAVEAAPPFTASQVVDEFVAGGAWSGVNSADFTPDGRVVLGYLSGALKVVDLATGVATQQLFGSDVLSGGEAGQLDVLVDPAFSTNKRFYTYSVSNATAQLVVARYTVGATANATSGSRVVVWTSAESMNRAKPYHVGGSINFGPDGKLYISTGDNLSTTGAPQDLSSVFGKILRINIDGTVPTDNPFYDGAGPNLDEVWAYGFRNAYRTSFDSVTGEYLVADVGGNVSATAFEELNIVTAGGNYGWPLCEGPLVKANPAQGANCPSGTKAPLYVYRHNIGQGCCMNRAIIGGEVYRGTQFPAAFRGTYMFADYPTGEFSWLERSGSSVTAGSLFTTSLAGANPVWMGVNPYDGAVYWLHYGWGQDGQLRRFRYAGGGTGAPVIDTSTADRTSGGAPLTVAFTGAAHDPDGTLVTYSWDFGDGTTSTSLSPTHTYTAAGNYSAQLSVSSGGQTTRATPISIRAGSPPTATITGPADGTTFVGGQTLRLTGTGTDPEDGALASSALSWTVTLRHEDHQHPVSTFVGSSGDLTIDTSGHGWEGNTRLEVRLTVVDRDGLTASKAITLRPSKVTARFTSNLAGVNVSIDSIAQPVPFDQESLIGFRHLVSVPATQCVADELWRFDRWSDQLGREHEIVVPTANTAYEATYVKASTDCNGVSPTTTTTTTTTTTVTTAPAGAAAAASTPGPVPALDGSVPLDDPAAADFLVAADSRAPGASAAFVNLAMARATAPGYITADRCSALAETPQSTSSGNHPALDAVSNLALVRLDADGRFCIYSQVPTQIIADVQGTFSPTGALGFTPSAPRRLLDSRDADAALVAAGTITRVTGAAPAGTPAALVNITMTDGARPGYVTADRCSVMVAGAQTKSTGNHLTTEASSNLAVVPLDADGSFCIFNLSPVHLVVDSQGWFSADGAQRFSTVAPARVTDTRASGTPAAGSIVRVASGAPAGTTAVLANLTMVGAGQSGYVTAGRCSTLAAEPQRTSSGNHGNAGAVANLAVVPVDADGSFCVYVQRSVDLVVDVQGTFSTSGQLGFTPVAPVRVLNTHPDA